MAKRNYVVVFDIDSTLCHTQIIFSDSRMKEIRDVNPECPIICYRNNPTYITEHVFLPYLQVLMNYLIASGVRIVFFSSATEDRNLVVSSKLLEEILGDTYYQSLKSQGQFDVLSKQHMRPGNTEGEGNNVKDLTKVVSGDENVLDAILIEDQPSYSAHDQGPCIYVIDCEFWYTTQKNETKYTYCKNTIYYLLGLFKSYFENDDYKQLPLRKGIEKILPQEKLQYTSQMEDSTFVSEMICLGLSEVRKTYPEAIFYGYMILIETYAFEDFNPHHTKEEVEEILRNILHNPKIVVNSTIKVFLKYLEDHKKSLQSEIVEDYFYKVKSLMEGG